MAEELSYSISISGHTDTIPVEEVAEEARKAVKALPGVSHATLSTGSRTIDLTKPAADVAAEATKEGGS